MAKIKEEKSSNQILEEKISYKRKNSWDFFSSTSDRKKIFDLAESYKNFISANKTERQCVASAIPVLKKAGFQELSKIRKLAPNSKIYATANNKNIAAIVTGRKPLSSGVNIVLAHIDCPRVDLKPQPLYEDEQLALLKTHYYGGIKKYQWPTIPLAIHGVAITQEGKEVNISIGESEKDPVFMFTDLLPHLARRQMAKKLKEGIEGEEMNLLIGSIPVNDAKVKAKVKFTVLKYLYENYKLTEEDFISAELEIVPAGKARDMGLDRSLVAGYGQDDRICAYTGLEAILNIKKPEKTSILIWLDREEIGSEGNTSAQGVFLEQVVSQLLEKDDYHPDNIALRRVFEKSKAISADVDTVIDPNFKSVCEPQNTPKLGHGVVVTKYSGYGGKYGASEASAEYLASLRRLLNSEKIPWQTGELGKIDEGGGGTIAKYIANRGIDILDSGPGLLNMHAPWEISSKADLYSTYLFYKAFFEKF